MNLTCSQTVDLRNISSLLPYVYLPNEWIIYAIVWPFIFLFGFTGNVMFICTVKRVSSLHTSTFIFLASLALNDLFVLLGVGLDNIVDFLMNPIRNGDIYFLKIVCFFFTWFCFNSSLCFVTLVSIERYFAICHPIKHRLLKGTKRTIKLICIVFVASFVGTSAVLLPFVDPMILCIIWPLHEPFTSSYPRLTKMLPVDEFALDGVIFQISQIVVIGCVLFALFINIYLYIRILQALRKRKCDKTLQMSADFERNIHQASLMVIVNGLIFYLCYSVFLVVLSINVMFSFKLVMLNAYQYIILNNVNYTFILINSAINPIVYFITNNSYRHAFKQSWMCFRRQ